MAAPVSLGSIEGRNVFAGNSFPNASINIGDSKEPQRQPQVCRAIHFPRNDDFVQRSTISEHIARLLPPKAEYQSAALWGLGGSGKTQLALEYAYSRCSDPNCSVFWVHADTETSFAQDYKWIAAKLGLADELDGEKLLAAVCSYIEALPQWVFILDNADDLTLFGVRNGQDSTQNVAPNPNLSKHVPRGPFGTVLWTSRDQRISGSIVGPRRGIHVLRMTDLEAETLFQSLAVLELREGEGQNDDMGRLLVEVEWLPLAIAQAAAYIRRTKTSVAEYLKKIQQRKKRWNILKRSEHDPHRRPEVSNSILETWNISMEHIRKENKMAYDILTVLAYVDNQNIPFEMIWEIVQSQVGKDPDSSSNGKHIQNAISTSSPGYSGSDSEADDDCEEHVIEAVVRLEEFSFLTLRASKEGRRSRAYDMHKLVQEAISYNLYLRKGDTSDEARSARRIGVEVIDKLFPKEWTRETWDQCEKYLGHAQRAGEWAQHHDEDGNVAKLLLNVSDYLFGRGRWNEKEGVDVLAIRLQQSLLGDRNPATIQSMTNLATTYHHQGRYTEAEKSFVQALGLRQDILGDKHPDTISTMMSLGMTYHSLGRYNETEKMFVKALELCRDVLGDEHPDTVSTMASLAATYNSQGRYNEAEKLKVEAIALQRDILGDKHPDTISSMGSLAATYHDQGRFDEAEKMKVQVLALEREVLGDKHPNTISAMSDLATTYYNQRRYDEAEKIYVEVLALRREVLGNWNPYTIQSMANLGAAYYSQGRYDKAEKIDSEALALRLDALGDRHPSTISSMAGLAATYTNQGRFNEAENIEKQVLALRRDVLGHKHPNTISAMSNLAGTYYYQKRYEEAEKIYIEVLELRRDVLGDKHPDTISSRAYLKTIQRARESGLSTGNSALQTAELSPEL